MMLDPAQELLLEYLNPKPKDRILILEGGAGQLANEVAALLPEGEVLTLARDVRAVAAAQKLLVATANAATTEAVFPTDTGWDKVLLTMPKGRRYARTLLSAAWNALQPGGQLLLAGPTRQGAKAMITDAKRIFGNAAVLGYRNHQRVAVCIRGEKFPDPLPKAFQQVGVAPNTNHEIEVQHSAGKLKLITHPGIFSWDGLDEGTAFLLEHLQVERAQRVWDVGCGYGVIGLAAAQAGAGRVIMSDVNLIGVDYAQRNAHINQLETKVTILAAAGFNLPAPNQASFDLIVSNPAFHQGHAVNKSMADQLIAEAPEFLSWNGKLVIVANRFLNYDLNMKKYFRHVKRIAETNKFHVIEAKK